MTMKCPHYSIELLNSVKSCKKIFVPPSSISSSETDQASFLQKSIPPEFTKNIIFYSLVVASTFLVMNKDNDSMGPIFQ